MKISEGPIPAIFTLTLSGFHLDHVSMDCFYEAVSKTLLKSLYTNTLYLFSFQKTCSVVRDGNNSDLYSVSMGLLFVLLTSRWIIFIICSSPILGIETNVSHLWFQLCSFRDRNAAYPSPSSGSSLELCQLLQSTYNKN